MAINAGARRHRLPLRSRHLRGRGRSQEGLRQASRGDRARQGRRQPTRCAWSIASCRRRSRRPTTASTSPTPRCTPAIPATPGAAPPTSADRRARAARGSGRTRSPTCCAPRCAGRARSSRVWRWSGRRCWWPPPWRRSGFRWRRRGLPMPDRATWAGAVLLLSSSIVALLLAGRSRQRFYGLMPPRGQQWMWMLVPGAVGGLVGGAWTQGIAGPAPSAAALLVAIAAGVAAELAFRGAAHGTLARFFRMSFPPSRWVPSLPVMIAGALYALVTPLLGLGDPHAPIAALASARLAGGGRPGRAAGGSGRRAGPRSQRQRAGQRRGPPRRHVGGGARGVGVDPSRRRRAAYIAYKDFSRPWGPAAAGGLGW